MMKTFEIENKKIELFDCGIDTAPLVILNTVMNEGQSVWKEVQKLNPPAFTLCAIGNLQWDCDMSPWAIPPISKKDTPCSGGADKYLEVLCSKIIPAIKKSPEYIALTGYSLAGLFALYSIYKTDMFLRVASASGSMWFPGFIDFVQNNEMKNKPDYIYLSLGNREKHSRNKILQTVEDNTLLVYEFYKKQGINTTFEYNSGNHFTQTTQRMAKGIYDVLSFPKLNN